MLYNIHYDICALIITVCIIILYHAKKQLPLFQNKVFFMLIYITFISIIFDLLCGIGLSYPQKVSREYQMITNTVYFIFRHLLVFLFAMYAISLSGKYKSIPMLTKCLLYVPLAIEMISIILTPKYEIIFRIDEQNRYVRAPGISILYFGAFYFLAFAGIYAYIYRKVIPNRIRKCVISFILLSLFPVMVQLVFPTLMIEAFGISICILLMYLTIQKPEELLDTETSLLNEKAFITMIPIDIAINKGFSIVTIILDEFASFNHTLGIFLIKTLTNKVAEFLKQSAKPHTLYRIAPHKFCIIVDSRKEDQIEELVEQIQSRFDKPWKYEGGQVKLAIKCCVIECPLEAKSVEQVLDYIETTELKKRSANIIRVSNLENSHRKRVEDVKRAIREAIELELFEVYYQPIYSTKKKMINSAEALIRLKDEKLGFISPEEFIPIAEQTGHILKIGRFVLESVCRFIKTEKLEEKGIEYIEVNLSVIECMQNNIRNEFQEILQKYGVRPDQINLEITETAQAYSLEVLKDNIYEIKNCGFELSLDDYGTGYSSISYLMNLPFHFVKIDKTIVWAAFQEERIAEFIQTMIKTIKGLNMQIIAEGVETLDQANELIQWGCEYLQGYYFSRPVPKQEFLAMLLEPKTVP